MQISKKIKYGFTGVLLLFTFACHAQPFTFAHVTDTHVGSGTGADDLRRTVRDINQQPGIAFVVLTGDVTEFGADGEIKLARQVLDSLLVPWYVIPGNHDANWSESGGNTFRSVFGAETFAFEQHGYRFVGTNSGPNMRMSPGQVPRENLVWLDSLFSAGNDAEKPLIYFNHYPQDSSLNNWYEAIDRLKTQNIQLLICGHGHQNEQTSYEGIPSIMGRSNLRAKDSVGGYNLVTIEDGVVTYRERNPGIGTKDHWATISLQNHRFDKDKRKWPRPDFRVNDRYSKVIPEWTYQDDSDVGAGMAVYKKSIIAVNTAGQVYALNSRTGKKIWTYQTGGKIYSTPAVWKKYVVVGSADNQVYCLAAATGKLLWKYAAGKPVLGSALIQDGIAYIGASDEEFRAIDIKSGELKWSFKGVKGHITDKPLFYNHTVYFGSWGNGFYALDPENGRLKWSWDNGQSNRMFSAASCYPVGAGGRIFVVAPDRYMTALNAGTGDVTWRKQMAGIRVRESMGLSQDSSLVYVKTMDGELVGISTTADDMQVAWRSALRLPYELDPSAIVTAGEEIFVPSHSGLISAVNVTDGHVRWQYKTSNAMVNPVLPLKDRRVAVSTMDGKIVCLNYKDTK